ncbi:gamma-glutamylcyclotransferase family protein [Acinetobacter ursingii]|uniref:gamma-glutamylcyclotransferase family protein n=1 Tax=Acinetobacter ursingii TaxID=108980 RepID=UPI000CC3D815|nr:gamma-glutamylcyclotransferase family protein [Acinetobacter ursingii]MCU4352929.1 gamma-glutamylcyclotransferase [Acinetobacter ursingii]MDI3239744.1 gamma-glutamylcyclotransferase [Acinetobacter ursingii]PMC98070.1 gamma-glutamylcyclotransferase [Acinetobacter ursingii]PPZ93197.1 gamma-glutamylcyclotransferase [Acinetobacter ursingii]
MHQHLFVYGTLGPNKPNSHILESIGGTWINGHVKGFLRQQGWGADLGSPGLILDPNGESVFGHIFSSNQLNMLWESLDEFEGNEYQRILINGTLENGQIQQAYVYALNSPA